MTFILTLTHSIYHSYYHVNSDFIIREIPIQKFDYLHKKLYLAYLNVKYQIYYFRFINTYLTKFLRLDLLFVIMNR